MCDEDGRRIPYMCGSGTAFNQQYRICDWIHNFDCKEADKWLANYMMYHVRRKKHLVIVPLYMHRFYLNELTYVTDPPKVQSASN